MNIRVDTNYGVILVIQIDMHLLSNKGTTVSKRYSSEKIWGMERKKRGLIKIVC